MAADADLFCIAPQQRIVHVVTEAIAVVAIAPTLAWIATRKRPLNTTEKALLWAMFAGTIAVDGWLVYRFLSGQQDEG